MKKKVVLAYSGGLDTSVCVKWLVEEKDLDVICFSADIGQGVNPKLLTKRARASGAKKLYVKDLRKEFVSDFIFPALKAGAVYESKYYLATALSRPLIAKALVDIAKKEKASYIAHGCTGKGNDQVRFEVSTGALAPELDVIAPLREWDLTSREEEIEYAREKKIPLEFGAKKLYSVDENLWGRSIEAGKLEDPWVEPPAEVYKDTTDPAKAPSKPTVVTIHFEKGIPVGLNGKRTDSLKLIAQLKTLGGKHGVGRSDLVENRLVGIKSREIYEAPAAVILGAAHEALENLTLDRNLFHYKRLLAERYAELVYDGLWFTPLKAALDAFVDTASRRVTGDIRVKLFKGNATVVGRKSPYSLYQEKLATYGKKDVFDRRIAEGFIKVWGLPYRGKEK